MMFNKSKHKQDKLKNHTDKSQLTACIGARCLEAHRCGLAPAPTTVHIDIFQALHKNTMLAQ